MKLSTQLGVNMLAHDTDEEVAVLVDLVAPAVNSSEARPPTSLEVVLDRSGSMAGEPIEAAKEALIGLIRRLENRDNFGLVVFGSAAQVVVPAGPLLDKEEAIWLISNIFVGGGTDLGAGYLRGLQEINRVAGETGGTLLVISDGHINQGITDPVDFARLAGAAYGKGIVTSTLGYGLGYDESLLSVIARDGSGNHVFAADPDAAGSAIASEVTGLLSKAVQAVSLTVTFTSDVERVSLYNDLPAMYVDERTLMIELGDFYCGEERKLLLKFNVPGLPALGLAQIATLELRYVALPALLEQVVTLPVSVNVVPGDEAAGRVANPVVRTEQLFQEAQLSKKQASEALSHGDQEGASKLIENAIASLESAGLEVPADLRASLAEEAHQLRNLSMWFDTDPNYASKLTQTSFHEGSRKRGRTVEASGEDDEHD